MMATIMLSEMIVWVLHKTNEYCPYYLITLKLAQKAMQYKHIYEYTKQRFRLVPSTRFGSVVRGKVPTKGIFF